jgi:hypothetical protein
MLNSLGTVLYVMPNTSYGWSLVADFRLALSAKDPGML